MTRLQNSIFPATRAAETPGVRDQTYTVYVDSKEYKLLLKKRMNEDVAKQLKTKSFDVRYKLPDQAEVTVMSLDLEGALPSSPKSYRSIDFKLNDPTPLVAKEFLTFSG